MIAALHPRTRTGGTARIDGERRSQRLVTAFVISGLVFMLLPGTFLGVWNLIDFAGPSAGIGSPGMASGSWAGADLRLDRVIHSRHRVLFAYQDEKHKGLSRPRWLGLLESLDRRGANALVRRSCQ